MLLDILQAMLKFTFNFGAIVGCAFMVICTVLVIICVLTGDIKISIVRSKEEKENE